MSTRNSLRLYTAAELAGRADESVVLLTERPLRLVEGARNVVHGESNLGKTFFALSAAVSVARDGRRVLVFVGEGAEGHTASRLRGLCLGQGAELVGLGDRLISVFGAGVIDEPEGEEVLLSLVDRLQPALTIVDPLASYFVGDENKSDTVAKVLVVLDRVVALGSALLLVHHDRKLSRDAGRDMRGHSRIRAWADTIAGLEARGGLVVVHDEKQRHLEKAAPLAFELVFEPEGVIRIVGRPVPATGRPARSDPSTRRAEQVRQLLATGPRTKHQLRTSLHISGDAVDEVLSDLMARHTVVRRTERVRDARGREREQTVYGLAEGPAEESAAVG